MFQNVLKTFQKAFNSLSEPEEIPNLPLPSVLTFPSHQIKITSLLGEGGFSYVFKCYEIRTFQEYALKRLLIHNKSERMSIDNEIAVMKKIKSENVIGYYGQKKDYVEGNEVVWLLMEIGEESVYDVMNRYVKSNRRFSNEEVLDIFYSTCLAIKELHVNDIVHRDIKIENILVCKGVYKLCDFGSCTTRTYDLNVKNDRMEAEEDINKNTTLEYRAPEMVDMYSGYVINTQSDIWALGCLLYKLCYFVGPFDNASSLQILNGKYRIPTRGTVMRVKPEIVELMKGLLEVNPNKRMDIFDVLQEVSKIMEKKYDLVKPQKFFKKARVNTVVRKTKHHNIKKRKKKKLFESLNDNNDNNRNKKNDDVEFEFGEFNDDGNYDEENDLFSQLDWEDNKQGNNNNRKRIKKKLSGEKGNNKSSGKRMIKKQLSGNKDSQTTSTMVILDDNEEEEENDELFDWNDDEKQNEEKMSSPKKNEEEALFDWNESNENKDKKEPQKEELFDWNDVESNNNKPEEKTVNNDSKNDGEKELLFKDNDEFSWNKEELKIEKPGKSDEHNDNYPMKELGSPLFKEDDDFNWNVNNNNNNKKDTSTNDNKEKEEIERVESLGSIFKDEDDEFSKFESSEKNVSSLSQQNSVNSEILLPRSMNSNVSITKEETKELFGPLKKQFRRNSFDKFFLAKFYSTNFIFPHSNFQPLTYHLSS